MVNWNADCNYKLLLAIIKQCDIKPSNEKLAQELTEVFGEKVTASAVQQQLKKLKKIANQDNSGEGAPATPDKTSSPSKVTKPKANTPKKKGEKRTLESSQSDDNEDKKDSKLIKVEVA